MAITIFVGQLNNWFYFFVSVSPLLLCIIYQFIRNKFKFFSVGEAIIGSADKHNILQQTKKFSITRWPLFLLIAFTLIINCVLFNGLSDGQVYNLGFVIFYTILFFCTYYGVKNFSIAPDMLPLFLLLGGLLYASAEYKHSSQMLFPGVYISNIYYCLVALWLVLGFVYKKYAFELPTESVEE